MKCSLGRTTMKTEAKACLLRVPLHRPQLPCLLPAPASAGNTMWLEPPIWTSENQTPRVLYFGALGIFRWGCSTGIVCKCARTEKRPTLKSFTSHAFWIRSTQPILTRHSCRHCVALNTAQTAFLLVNTKNSKDYAWGIHFFFKILLIYFYLKCKYKIYKLECERQRKKDLSVSSSLPKHPQ